MHMSIVYCNIITYCNHQTSLFDAKFYIAFDIYCLTNNKKKHSAMQFLFQSLLVCLV